MITNTPATPTQEKVLRTLGGFPMLLVNLVLVSATPIALMLTSVPRPGHLMAVALLISILGIISLRGHFTRQPNEARVLILFGHYRGTVRDSGFHWANPFYARYRGQVPSKGQGHSSLPSELRSGRKSGPGLSGQQWWSSKLSLRANNFNSPTLKVNDNRGNPG